MSKKKYYFYLSIGFLTGMFIVLPLLEWLGVPSFAKVLTFLFGEPNGINKIIAVLFSLFLIFLILLFSNKLYKKSSKS